MVLPVDPIAAATLSFTLASKAWGAFKNALHFSDDASDLILRLDIEEARLHIWSSNAGYEKEGDSFDQCLLPVIELIDGVLQKLTTLFENADDLRTRYGLVDSPSEADESKKLQRFLANLSRALKTADVKTQTSAKDDGGIVPRPIHRASTMKRIKWGLRDKTRFQTLVESVETYILKLTQLLNDSQKKKLAEDKKRHDSIIIGTIEDTETLQIVREATQVGIQDESLDNLCGRLALSDRMQSTEVSAATSQFLLSRTDFPCLGEARDGSVTRMLTHQTASSSPMILLEKKTYPSDFDHDNLELLSEKIERIVKLLSVQRGDVRTLKCIGYIHDRIGHCWWLAFEYPTIDPIPTVSQTPISLMDVFADKTSIRPPLEARVGLAASLTSSLSALFNSSWLHKSIRSENILFPQHTTVQNMKFDTMNSISPFLTGFEYSRQHKEQSWGTLSNDINHSIYRHPLYQGHVPGRYRIQYDVYSLGLVLVDIARWMPLSSLLDSKKPESKKSGSSSSKKPQDSKKPSSTTSNQLQLSPDMGNFTEAHARELQKRVLYFVDKEMAFRVGTPYRDAVRWCLTYADEKVKPDVQRMLENGVVSVKEETDWRSAMEFYDHVVVPLGRLVTSLSVN